MKIQMLQLYNSEMQSGYAITYSTFNEPKSLDMFDINIISLQNQSIWRYNKDSQTTLECTNDFRSIKRMIASSKKATNLIALPQNYSHQWDYYYDTYHGDSLLKDELSNLKDHLLATLIPQNHTKEFNLLYENSITDIEGSKFESSFCFIDCNDDTTDVTRSNDADKMTTIRFDNLILTTLDLHSDGAQFDDFIKGIGLDTQKSEVPQWLTDYECFDDAEQKKLIETSNQEIDTLNDKIKRANEKLEDNLKYKSILSTNGDELASVVFEILEKTLDCDLSDFVDEKKEDFLIKKEGISFIGEIKGITSNVKSENVSQLDVHYQSYLDDLQEQGIEENLKPLLIINPFRTKPIDEREEVHENQIKLAERNGSLIITTETLLKIFEQFLESRISSEKIVSVFRSKIGLLTADVFFREAEKIDISEYTI